jgi:hypothetical protein
MNPLHILTLYLYKMLFNIILPSAFKSSKYGKAKFVFVLN